MFIAEGYAPRDSTFVQLKKTYVSETAYTLFCFFAALGIFQAFSTFCFTHYHRAKRYVQLCVGVYAGGGGGGFGSCNCVCNCVCT